MCACAIDIFLKDIWPSNAEISDMITKCLGRELFIERYSNVYEGPQKWKEISGKF